jgi:hypothetical protein
LRGEFLNAFNNVNFFANTNLTNFTSATFGQVTSASTDPNNTQDPGGRLVQIVARINFQAGVFRQDPGEERSVNYAPPQFFG